MKVKQDSGDDGSYRTAQVGPGDRGRDKKKKIGFYLDLIWIEIGVLKKKKKSKTK